MSDLNAEAGPSSAPTTGFSAASLATSTSRRRSSATRPGRSRSSRSRATSALSVRSDSSAVSSGGARVDWSSGEGYDYVQPDQQISAFLHCPICLGPFYDPYVSDVCSHTFCKLCITTALTDGDRVGTGADGADSDAGHDPATAVSSSAARCPSCRAPVRLDNFKPTALLIKNMVDTLLVRCPNREKGCKHTCERHLLRGHVAKDCPYEYVDEDLNDGKKCGCSSKVMRKDWESHGVTCPKRKVRCGTCQLDVRADEMEQHCQSCSPEPAECDFCGLQATKSTLPLHLATCPTAPVPCHHAQYGCDWIGPRWQLTGDALDDTNSSAATYHLSTCRYEPLKAFFAVFTRQTTELKQENATLREKLTELENKQRSCDWRVRDCVHSLGTWYRSAGESAASTSSQGRGSQSIGGNAIDAEWEDFPLDAEVWEQNHRPQLRTVASGSSRSVGGVDHHGSVSGAVRQAFSPSSPHRSGVSGRSSLHDAGRGLVAPPLPPLGLASSSAPSVSAMDMPFSPYTPSDRGAPVRPPSATHPLQPVSLDLDTTSLSSLLSTLQSSISTLVAALGSLERRNEESHLTAVSASFEAGRATEEAASLRHVVHAIRMQIHQILMQQQRVALFSPPGVGPAGFMSAQGEAAASPGAAARAQPMDPNVAAAGPALGLNPSMLVRRWAGLDQTKL